MYHSLDSIEWESLYINTGDWHKLDNIGSIQCFIMLIIYWMDNLQTKDNGTYASRNFCDTDLVLNCFGLFLTMLMQADHPWELKNTIIPIIIFAIIGIAKNLFYRVARFNKHFLKQGGIWLGLAVICFIKGLDDDNDYLRIYHGLWHTGGSIASFYLWQTIDKDREIKGIHVTKYCKQPRFGFWQLTREMLQLKPYYKKVSL